MSLMFWFGLAGYWSARVAQANEHRWAFVWIFTLFIFNMAVNWYGSDELKYHLMILIINSFWMAFFLSTLIFVGTVMAKMRRIQRSLFDPKFMDAAEAGSNMGVKIGDKINIANSASNIHEIHIPHEIHDIHNIF